MDLNELKGQIVREALGLGFEYGRILTFVDIKRYITRIESKNLAFGQVSANSEPGYPGQGK